MTQYVIVNLDDDGSAYGPFPSKAAVNAWMRGLLEDMNDDLTDHAPLVDEGVRRCVYEINGETCGLLEDEHAAAIAGWSDEEIAGEIFEMGFRPMELHTNVPEASGADAREARLLAYLDGMTTYEVELTYGETVGAIVAEARKAAAQ